MPYYANFMLFSTFFMHKLVPNRQNKATFPHEYQEESNAVREQPPRICKNNKSKISCESAIGEHLIANPECAKTYTDDNFRIIGQARSSFHLSVLESVYIKTQNQVFCRQKSLCSLWDSSSKQC